MIIKSLNIISYGKFKNKKIDFNEGLNVVYGGNEAGKSTMMSFIKAMLYGFTASRSADISQNERKKYMPWDGSNMKGEMDICTDDGKNVRITRTTGKSQSFDTLECFDTFNAEKYNFVPENEVGISEDAFLKTFYIKQLGSRISGENEEISQKLINLTYSASEDISCKTAIDTLREEMKKYKALKGNGGLINSLQSKITDLNTELSVAEKKRCESFEAAEKAKSLSADIEKYRSLINGFQKMRDTEKLRISFEKAENAKKEQEQIENELRNVEAETEKISKYLDNNKQYELKPSDIIYRSEKDSGKIKDEIDYRKKRRVLIPYIISFLIETTLSFGIYFVTHNIFFLIGFLAFSGIINAILGIIAENKRKDTLKKLYAEYEAIINYNKETFEEFKKYGVSSIKEYTDNVTAYNDAKNMYKNLIEKISAMKNKLSELKSVINSQNFSSEYTYTAEQKYSLQEIDEEEKKVHRMLEECVAERARIEGILISEGKDKRTPDMILTERASVVEELDAAFAEYEALSLAAECLGEAYAQMNSDYTPHINDKASSILKRITGNKYSELYIDKKYAVKLQCDGTKNLGYFSSGTCDAVYFSVRLAVTDTLFGQNKPLFIDDGFVQYDELREENAFEELRSRAKSGQQIIIFTCRNPQAYAEKFDCNIINLF